MSHYDSACRKLLSDVNARASAIDAMLSNLTPEWLAWEVPTILLELERGGAPVSSANQARIRGLYAMHLTGECFASPASFEALAWLFSGVEAPGLTPHPIDMLRAIDEVRAVAAAHGETLPVYADDVLGRIAEVCRREGYIALPNAFSDIQGLIRAELSEDGLAIEKKAQQLARSALSSSKTAAHNAFSETPEGVAGARCAALELELTRR